MQSAALFFRFVNQILLQEGAETKEHAMVFLNSHLSSSVLRAFPESFGASAMTCSSQKCLCQQKDALVKHCFCKVFYRKTLSFCYGEVGKL